MIDFLELARLSTAETRSAQTTLNVLVFAGLASSRLRGEAFLCGYACRMFRGQDNGANQKAAWSRGSREPGGLEPEN